MATEEKIPASSFRLIIREELDKARENIKCDTDEALCSTFSRIGIDLKNQHDVNRMHASIQHMHRIREAQSETFSTVKKALVNVAVPGIVVTGWALLIEYLKSGGKG